MSKENKMSGLGFVTAWDLLQMENQCREVLSKILGCEEQDLIDTDYDGCN